MGDKNNSSTLVLFGYFVLTLLFITVNANDLETEDETSFSYVVGATDGPQNWGNLNPNWTLCGTGKSQSPINILDYKVKLNRTLGDLNINYRPAEALIRNAGYEIEVKWTGDAGGVIINGDEFKLQEVHWHTPAEHTVNGIRFNMELHIVHVNSGGDIAVVGILYKLGPADPFLAQFLPYLPSASEEGFPLGIVDPSSVKIPGREYYRYNGSLTTPPCSENVTWTIFKRVKTVSIEQVHALKDAIDDENTGNARPIQPLNGRTVYIFEPKPYLS
ncbi:alpha carbonic anhydrase 7 [Sesamum indicum]|uniref:Alpha carbonic anhydrase 7 n=1 Tax=Sesamum indicum TaxID=4182 RepID=A0A6I9T0C5_SESIN|nr:alpha carbonic anhydrase 7 [Sesamum indicum]